MKPWAGILNTKGSSFSIHDPPPRSTLPDTLPSSRHYKYQRKMGRNQAHNAMNWLRIGGLAELVSGCGSDVEIKTTAARLCDSGTTYILR